MNTWSAMVSSRLLLFSLAIFMLIAVVVGQPAFDLNSFCSSGESDCTAKRTSDACIQHHLRRSSLSSYSNGSPHIHLRLPHSNGSNIVDLFMWNTPFCQTDFRLTVVLKTSGKYRISWRSPPRAAAALGFYHTCTGEDSDIVYGQALRRGDVNSTVCRICIQTATKEILKQCVSEDAMIWFELCLVRYDSVQSVYMSGSFTTGKFINRRYNASFHWLLDALRPLPASQGNKHPKRLKHQKLAIGRHLLVYNNLSINPPNLGKKERANNGRVRRESTLPNTIRERRKISERTTRKEREQRKKRKSFLPKMISLEQ
ncbi:uncharacterized protein LOC109003350 [Juglans regia]|uniref:Uncharacterized protein LOC109003350 n=1 Tax=Juglans regia TaxID=51240 RepID=A0A6P9EP15_JUGRE|nr:uncharacterized protein LOC109003350 [Juglans regia]